MLLRLKPSARSTPTSRIRPETAAYIVYPLSVAGCALSVALGLIPVSILECAKLVRRIAGRPAAEGGGD